MAPQDLVKSNAFQETYKRKPGHDQTNTHYCPGCGHGVIHKLIAEALSDMGLKDRAIMVAPVGCSVFLYYYFGCSAVSAAHGRAPAVLTATGRIHPDAINISYQGDGDLAAIGTNNIIHAANRGEKMAVFFVNNATYGMTGGQMAPTTLVGMKTTTSPYGRSVENEGHPILMCELMSTLSAPVYVERVSLHDNKGILGTRKAIRKALKIQDEKKGFAFVEILSPCPTNWKVDPAKAGEWLREKMHPVFKPGVYKDIVEDVEPLSAPKPPISNDALKELLGVGPAEKKAEDIVTPDFKDEVHYRFAGFGGQGVLSMGVLLAKTAMFSGLEVTWIPSYGPEMRGGTANSTVVVSKRQIGSPVVQQSDVLMALNAPSLEKFLPTVKAGGVAIYDSSLIPDPKDAPKDVKLIAVPARDLAVEQGEVRAANVVMLGAYQAVTGLYDPAALDEALADSFGSEALLKVNRAALQAGIDFIRKQ